MQSPFNNQGGRTRDMALVLKAIEPVHGSGKVFVHGEYWYACSDQPIAAGSEIRIIQFLDGLKLKVEAVAINNMEQPRSIKED